MTHHILACALYCNSDGSTNALGDMAAWLIGIPLGLCALIGAVRLLTGNYGQRGRRR